MYRKGEKVKAVVEGKEFLNEAMKGFCEGRGIRIEPPVGYHLEGDGVERSMKTISQRGPAVRYECTGF
jgi:hypothetical protein